MKKMILSFLIMLSLVMNVHADEHHRLSKEELLQDKLFACYDLGLSEQEKQVIDALVITKDITINNYAQLDHLQEQLVDYLQQLGNDEQVAQDGAIVISQVVDNALQLLDAPTGWITLRASLPNQLYDMPRWHTDGSYYQPHGQLGYKFVWTLRGPSTLLVDIDDDLRIQFQRIQSQGTLSRQQIESLSRQDSDTLNVSSRQQAAQLFQNLPIVRAEKYQAILFKISDRNQAAVHSEPSIKELRLFMAIVPGTYEQIAQWRKGHEKK